MLSIFYRDDSLFSVERALKESHVHSTLGSHPLRSNRGNGWHTDNDRKDRMQHVISYCMGRATGCFDRKDVAVWDLFPRGQIAHVADITPNERNHGATDHPAGRLVALQEGV